MGKFLQKTNILRDFHEDYYEDRVFWPRDVCGKYCEDISEFLEDHDKGMRCLNHLISDALKHLPDCLTYLSEFKDDRMYKFCAIPQIMALATLELCLDNKEVFQTSVKMRRGLSATYAYNTSNY